MKENKIGFCEKIVLEKKGYTFEFTEGLFNGYPEMKVTLNGKSSSVRFVSDEKILFGYEIEKVGGIGSQGIESTQYQKVKSMYESIKNRMEAQKKKEQEAKYAPLHIEMEKIALPKNNENPDDEKCRELLEKSKANSFYSKDPEDSGLNLASASACAKIEKEAEKMCNHNFKIQFWKTHTGDARLKLERDVSCDKCGFHHRDTVEEQLEARWF